MKTLRKLNTAPAKLVLGECPDITEFTVGMLTTKGKILEVLDEGECLWIANRLDGSERGGCQEWFSHEVKAVKPMILFDSTSIPVTNALMSYISSVYAGTSDEWAYNYRVINDTDIESIIANDGNCLIETLEGAELYNYWFANIDPNSEDGYDYETYEVKYKNKIPRLLKGIAIIHMAAEEKVKV